MLKTMKQELAVFVAKALEGAHGVTHDPVMEIPPRRELGDIATPAPLHLARELKNAPRKIAEATLETLESLSLPAWVSRVTIEGPGYLNFHLNRSAVAARLLEEPLIQPVDAAAEHKVVVEHTNINPNKAAHIGHLRNAVLGDVLVRCFRALGYPTETQNYIDDTGVQVADVVVGFMDLRGMSQDEVEALPEPFDYTCWDLYSDVGRWYQEDAARLELRRATLHELESGRGERAELGRLVARRIVNRHLKTMARLGVDYDVLTRESEILRLDFWSATFELLKKSGAIHLEEEGKNAGCWVMPLSESEEFKGLEDPDKVIVRSDATVTYVGKDIAYQMWKFGLSGLDFEYRPWPETDDLWETAPSGETQSPHTFGRADRVINVIDARQSYLQKIVRAGLEALGHPEQAERSIHFAYEMVSLSEATARQLGFLDDEGEGSLEMSGRKGIGVKADDLLDQLIDKSRGEIASRNEEASDEQLDSLARSISTAALRFFMTKATTTRVIAFDLEEALSFEGETGPYVQYSVVRARNIDRRLEEEGVSLALDASTAAQLPPELWADDLWDLALVAAQLQETVERAATTLELSLVARLALDLSQRFHAVYHRHPILRESDEQLRTVRLLAMKVFVRAAEEVAALLGVDLPDRM